MIKRTLTGYTLLIKGRVYLSLNLKEVLFLEELYK
jgi:hypothetical protein